MAIVLAGLEPIAMDSYGTLRTCYNKKFRAKCITNNSYEFTMNKKLDF